MKYRMAKQMTKDCIAPKDCRMKREKWIELQTRFRPLGQAELDKFKGKVKYDRHFLKRSYERSISNLDVQQVLKYGWVVERNKNVRGVSIVVLGYVGDNGSYRPIHIVFDVLSEDMWIAVTAYNPMSHSWKWSKSFDERICFCNHDEDC